MSNIPIKMNETALTTEEQIKAQALHKEYEDETGIAWNFGNNSDYNKWLEKKLFSVSPSKPTSDQEIIDAINKVASKLEESDKNDKSSKKSDASELKLDVKVREETLSYIRNVMQNNNMQHPDELFNYWKNKRDKASEMWKRLEESDPLNHPPQLREGEVEDGWVKIEDGLPEKSGQVLVCLKDTHDQYISFYKKSRKLFQIWGAGYDPILDMKVTHWQPLPNPPKQ